MRNIFDESIYLEWPEEKFEQVVDYLCQRLLSADRPSSDSPLLWSIWFDFVALGISIGGVCGKDGFHEICDMRFRHIWSAGAGYLMVPRGGQTIPVWINQPVAYAALRLCTYLCRTGNGPRNRPRRFPLDAYITPGYEERKQSLDYSECARLQDEFDRELGAIGEEIAPGLPSLNVRRLILLGRARLFRIYEPPVLAALIGEFRYTLTPMRQSDILRLLRVEETAGQKILRHQPKADSLQDTLRGRSTQPSIPNSNDFGNPIKLLRRELRLAMLESAELSKSERVVRRRRLKVRLAQLIRSTTKLVYGKDREPDWTGLAAIAVERPTKVFPADALLLTGFVSWLLKLSGREQLELSSILTYLNCLVAIVWRTSRAGQLRFLPLITRQELRALILGGGSASYTNRQITSINHFQAFVSDLSVVDQVWVPIAPISEINDKMRLVLTLDQVRSLVSELWGHRSYRVMRPVGMTSGNTESIPFGEILAAAVFIAANFGLRILELLNLKVDHISVEGEPTIWAFVYKGRARRKTVYRIAPGLPLSLEDRDWLIGYVARQRARSTDGYLFSTDKQRLTSQRLRYHWNVAAAKLGLDATLHDLRHFYVQRWVAIGEPITAISDRANHLSSYTTNNSYIHTFAQLQREQLQGFNDPLIASVWPEDIRLTTLAQMAGFSDRWVNATRISKLGITVYCLPKRRSKFVRSTDGLLALGLLVDKALS